MNPEPPYIWFGGKRAVAPIVWTALGDVGHYVEPFLGGAAVLLLRPHRPQLETVNDLDGFVPNFWRAVQAEPEALADAMDWPVTEIDLEARHRALCRQPDKAEFLARVKHDPRYYDVQRAAWWCWGLCAWIGSGWCAGEYFPEAQENSHGRGLGPNASKMPSVGRGEDVHRKQPHLGDTGRGVHRVGVIEDATCAASREALRTWMQALADRLRRVRVCCGDWARICTDGATDHGREVGVFLDPPYAGDVGRDNNIYREEDLTVSTRVRQWCLEHTDRPRYRIVLAGYEGEHDELEGHGWSVRAWKTRGGYANIGRDQGGQANRARERLWLSPSCLGVRDLPLFAAASAENSQHPQDCEDERCVMNTARVAIAKAKGEEQ